MKKLFSLVLLVTALTSNGQFTNILVSNQNSPTEPSIAINPNNTNILLAGANLNNYYVSLDSGITWTSNTLSSSYGVWGDPVTLIDNNGAFYFFHLSNATSWLDRIVCQKSTDNGQTFNNGTFFGLNGSKDQDKEWAAIDYNNGNIYVFWTEFDSYGSLSTNCKTRILFTKSTDNAQSWETPIKINQIDGNCEDEDLTVEGAVPAIGPNGEIYTSWAGPNGIVFDKSLDQGTTWLNNDISVTNLPGGWSFSIPGLDRANGMPITKCDISGGPNHGTIYINWSDQRNGTNDTDIWLKKSTDGGNTWSNIIRVNNDSTGNHQFLSWMDIDQTDGTIYIVFYDRRNYNDSRTDVFLAYSTDGGDSFTNIKISESPFIPDSTAFFGDYTNIVAHNGVIRPIWVRYDGINSGIWTALIHKNTLTTDQFLVETNFDIENYPNPITDIFTLKFKLRKPEKVSLTLNNFLGEKVYTIIDNKTYSYGKHLIKKPIKEFNLSNGIYFYTIKIGDKIYSKKIILNK
jgi:hypothetical protein